MSFVDHAVVNVTISQPFMALFTGLMIPPLLQYGRNEAPVCNPNTEARLRTLTVNISNGFLTRNLNLALYLSPILHHLTHSDPKP